MTHNDMAVRRCECEDGASNPIYRQRHGHRINKRMDARRCACAHAISDSPWSERICHKTGKQIYCKRKTNRQLSTSEGEKMLKNGFMCDFTFDLVAFRPHRHVKSLKWKLLVRSVRVLGHLEYVQRLSNYL